MDQTPANPELFTRYELRFGVIAVGMGLIRAEQLVDALRIQVDEDINTGGHRLLGQIPRSQSALSPDQIEGVLRSVLPASRTKVRCRRALITGCGRAPGGARVSGCSSGTLRIVAASTSMPVPHSSPTNTWASSIFSPVSAGSPPSFPGTERMLAVLVDRKRFQARGVPGFSCHP
jgi:hypothetical protein